MNVPYSKITHMLTNEAKFQSDEEIIDPDPDCSEEENKKTLELDNVRPKILFFFLILGL